MLEHRFFPNLQDFDAKPVAHRGVVTGINATVRFTPKDYEALKVAAAGEGRSVSEEVEVRVHRSIFEDGLKDIRHALDEIGSEQLGMWQELMAKAMARIAELEKSQTLNEEMIERAVTRALAKARLTINGTEP